MTNTYENMSRNHHRFLVCQNATLDNTLKDVQTVQTFSRRSEIFELSFTMTVYEKLYFEAYHTFILKYTAQLYFLFCRSEVTFEIH